MAQRIIKLTEQDIKNIVRESLDEITRAEFENYEGRLPNPAHTDRAFAVGDIVARRKVTKAKDEEGNAILNAAGKATKTNNYHFSRIVDIENGMLKLEDGSTVNPRNVFCTDTWYKIVRQRGGNAAGLTFDYEMIDGELWVTVDYRSDMNTHVKDRYRYSDVKNSSLNQPVRGIPMAVNNEMANTGFWIKEGDAIPQKSKNQLPDTQPVPKEFICYVNPGNSFRNAQNFGSWNFERGKDICSRYRWLRTTPTLWSLPIKKGDVNFENMKLKSTDGKKTIRMTPMEFSQWLQMQVKNPYFIEYRNSKKPEN